MRHTGYFRGSAKEGGFTLLEVTVSMFILTTVGLFFLSIFVSGAKYIGRAKIQSVAVNAAREIIEQAEAMPFDEILVGNTRIDTVVVPYGFTAPVDLGSEGGDLDDLDDFNGLSESSVPGYTVPLSRSVTVSYVSLDSLNSTLNQRSRYKKITVTLSSSEFPSNLVFSRVLVYY